MVRSQNKTIPQKSIENLETLFVALFWWHATALLIVYKTERKFVEVGSQRYWPTQIFKFCR